MLKAGDTMTGDLIMDGRRVTGLPTDAPTAQSDGASIAQVTNMISDTLTNFNVEPSEPLHVTNERYVDAQDEIVKEYVEEKILFLEALIFSKPAIP